MIAVASEANVGNQHDDEEDHPEQHKAGLNMHGRGSLALCIASLVFPMNHFVDGRDADPKSIGVITGFESGYDFIAINLRRDGIGQNTFESEANFDPHFPIFDGCHQKNAIIFAFLAEFPIAENFVGEIFDVIAIQRGNRKDHHLIAGLMFLVCQEFIQALDVGGGKDMGIIIDAAFELGNCRRGASG